MNENEAVDCDLLYLLGQQIKNLRIRKKQTQAFLCKEICDSTFLSKLENGKLKKVDINILFQIADKLEVNLGTIISKISKKYLD